MAEVVTVVAKLRAAMVKSDALAALLGERADAARKAEPGCLVYRPHRSTTDPNLFLFYSTGTRRPSKPTAPETISPASASGTDSPRSPVEVEIYRSMTG